MISAARSQRNPVGEAITNFQRQNLLSKIINSGIGQNQQLTDVVGTEGDTLDMRNAVQPANPGLWAIISSKFPFVGG